MVGRLHLEEGHAVESLIEALRTISSQGEPPIIGKREIARLLTQCFQGKYAGEFLPTIKEARETADSDALLLLVDYHLASEKSDDQIDHTLLAWDTLQATLALPELSTEDEQRTLTKCVELAPRMKQELGKAWLAQSFTDKPQRGVIILSTLGSTVSQAISKYPHSSPSRQKDLQLQTNAVNALIESKPESLHQWSEILTLLAENWMKEAEITEQFSQSTSIGPRMQYDIYGNYYFSNDGSSASYTGRGQISPIELNEMIELAPNDQWQKLISKSLKPRLMTLMAKLYLKASEEAKAFPYIEQLAVTLPERAHELAEEFLRVWIKNHDLNSSSNSTSRYSSYFFVYGYQSRAESIPLTRSKQERNLKELADWLVKLKALPIDALDEKLIVEAFTKCHSSAEVYRIEAIEEIMGDVSLLDDKTLAGLLQTMRNNLATIWKAPQIQQQNKTKRKKEDLQAEVLRGYQVSHQLLEKSLQTYPESWQLQLASAALLHDENAYQKEISSDSTFEDHRRQALEAFQIAADLYGKQVDPVDEKDYDITVYQIWFFAALGACDLGNVDEKNRLAESQPPLIKAAIEALPDQARKIHEDRFANGLFRALSGAKPNVKYRYLKAGLEIVGDHPLANEARKVFDYYNDLVTEIQFVTHFDGSDVVGQQPFGVFVDLKHTKDIERESGGFAKYLQNQNSMLYSYNYGRPIENYRDKFNDTVEAALGEHFEVLSVTFQHDSIQSRALPEPGWRLTPYAYLLLKAKGPEVDTLPSVSIDMDFMDTSGYVVLPIESPELPLDAKPEKGEPRPATEVKITQTLDERQADEGKLALEIKASAQGLVPPLEDLVNLQYPGFDVVTIDQQPLSVVKFDEEASTNVILSERLCTINMVAKPGQAKPEVFSFAAPLDSVNAQEVVYQRYDDADLVPVEPTFTLTQEYQPPGFQRYLYPALSALAGILIVAGILLRPRTPQIVATGIQPPAVVTPFTTIGYLQQIDERNHLAADQRNALNQTISKIENTYFQSEGEQTLDLHEIIGHWQKISLV